MSEAGLKVRQLAARADLPESTVYRHLDGKVDEPRARILRKYSDALSEEIGRHVSADELLGIEDSQPSWEPPPIDGFAELPVLGRVTAGEGGITEEHIEEYRHVPKTYIPEGQEKACFLVEATGESMIDAGIKSGDELLVCKAVSVNDGDVAVLDIDGEAVVKRVYVENDHLMLVSDNPDIPPRRVPRARLVGRVMWAKTDM